LRASRRGDPTPSTSYLLTASAWCALQGAAAFTAMRTNFVPLQLLAAVSVIGIGGPICARNYPAPRYAVMLVSLAIVPLAVGAAMTGEPWLLIMILQVPLFLVGALEIIRRFQRMAIATLQAEQSSYDHARHDALTGLLNRFGLAELEEEEFGGTSRRFVLFYLDLDGFKPINDRFGHKAGDTILRLVANRLKSSVRGGDVVARLGGDEFVIVASGMQPPAAETFSNRVVRVVSDEPYLLEDGSHVSIGISIGYACAPDDGVSRDDLHRKADAALYDAKAAGKRISKRFVGASITAAAAEPDLTSAISR
jgi:diguanylate cyclase (GGDEF)-like protein